MNSLIVVCLFAFVAIAAGKPATYTTKYDNVDLDEILANDRLLNNYSNCLLNKGNCTPDGAELKKVLPDAISNKCASCNEKQKNGSRKVLLYLIEHKPEIFAELEKLYDPSGTYKQQYCKDAKTEGLKVKVCN